MYEPCKFCNTPDSGPGADCCKESLRSWILVIESRLRECNIQNNNLRKYIGKLRGVIKSARDTLGRV